MFIEKRLRAVLFLCFLMLPILLAAQSALMINPNPVVFPDVEVGGMTTSSVYVSKADPYNPAPVGIQSISIVPEIFSYNFSPTLPYYLGDGETAEIILNCNPFTEGTVNGHLVITDNLYNVTDIPLSALVYTPTPPPPNLLIDPTIWDFGNVAVGDSLVKEFTVTLEAGAAFDANSVHSISTMGSAFYAYSYYAMPYPLGDGRSMTVRCVFRAVAIGTFTGELLIEDSTGEFYDLDLQGTGVAAPAGPQISVDPSIINLSLAEQNSNISQLKINNLGSLGFNYVIETDSLPPWIIVGESYDIEGKNITAPLSPGDSTYVNLRVTTTGLAPGEVYHDQIRVRATNADGTSYGTCDVYLEVTYRPVMAQFSATPTTPHLGDEVQFTDMSYTDPLSSTAVVSWSWDLDGDGTPDSNIQNPLYTYTEPGLYNVGLMVSNSSGATHEEYKTDYIHVTNNPPVITTAIDSLSIAEDGYYQAWFWDFFAEPEGDNVTFTAYGEAYLQIAILEDNVFQVIPVGNWFGTETLTLVATDQWGASSTHQITVYVTGVNDPPASKLPDVLYFVKNSTFNVDFGTYIYDIDNPVGELSLNMIQLAPTQPNIMVSYAAGIPGNLLASYTATPGWWGGPATYRVSINDHMGRAVTVDTLQIVVLERFTVRFGPEPLSYNLAGEIIPFVDLTLGNPDWWEWDFDNDGVVDSEEQNPEWFYTYAGLYSVKLTLGNTEAGETAFLLVQDMFNMIGTAVPPDAPAPPVMDPPGSPYNIQGDLIFPDGGEITILPDVTLNFLTEAPLELDGELNANGGTFQPGSGMNNWGGLRFGPGSGGSLQNCRFLNSNRPLTIDGGNPSLENLEFTPADTLELIDGEGLVIEGGSPQITGTLIRNYRTGVRLTGDGGRNTPTLTNIRVRNSSESSRPEGEITGILIEGDCDAILSDVIVSDYNIGLKIENEERSVSTPTLTNIRVRSSSETSRGLPVGILVSGEVAAQLEDVEIIGASSGLVYQGNGNATRTTPTLTNIRVRSSSETSRSFDSGIEISDQAAIILNNVQVENYTEGISITTGDSRAVSTPTLTNIRVRNSSETNRTVSTGLALSGNVVARVTDLETDNCTLGFSYLQSGDPSRVTATPTLTNIRVRNSSESSRNERLGILLDYPGRLVLDDVEIEDCTGALNVVNSQRALSTPTLTNIRVRNSSETQRFPNYGIMLGSGVTGSLSDCTVESSLQGLVIAPGNLTEIGPNFFKNCGVGIVASYPSGPRSLKAQTFKLEPDFPQMHPGWMFSAFDIQDSPSLKLQQNTMFGYYSLVMAGNSGINFNSNIAWGQTGIAMPFQMVGSTVQASFNNVRRSQDPLPGVGNINTDPFFVNVALDNLTLSSQSPCIDAGDPALPHDADGSRVDIGAHCYLHKADFEVDQIFVQTGSTVHFSNLSLGHNVPQLSQSYWDLGNNGSVEAQSFDWQHTFTQPGIYDLRLRMETGLLVDEIVIPGAVVVQNELLQPPDLHTVNRMGSDIHLAWNPVLLTVDEEPVAVDYYLIYSSIDPETGFRYVGFVSSPTLEYTHVGGAFDDRRFYLMIGYKGSRAQLEDYIRAHRELDPVEPSGGLRGRR